MDPLYEDRLKFQMHDFTRYAWVSQTAHDIWNARLARISHAWSEVNWRSINHDNRRYAVVNLSEDELIRRSILYFKQGLDVLPLHLCAKSNGPYSNILKKPKPDECHTIVAVIGKGDLEQFRKAWLTGDHDQIGEMLGYPKCCRQFFEECWIHKHSIDSTWAMARKSTRKRTGNLIEVDGPVGANILWRWLGVRLVLHLPCSFTCEFTQQKAELWEDVAKAEGYETEFLWIKEMLSWPVEWSALHGIAEIKNPIIKISATTDATAAKYVVRRRGTAYPLEGGQGLSFPFKAPNRLVVLDSPSYKRGLDNPVDDSQVFPMPWYYQDNGFSSLFAMNRCHKPIVKLILRHIGDGGGNILDLGCGNGALLKKICANSEGVVPYGIDKNVNAIKHAVELHPAYGKNFVIGNFFNRDTWIRPKTFSIGLLMIGRLADVPRDDAKQFLLTLAEHCKFLLVYMYPGYNKQQFNTLIKQFRLSLQDIEGDKAGIAEFVY